MANVRYKPDPNGMRELARSSGVQGAAMAGAQAVANTARAIDTRGTYDTLPATVTAGWNNESRSGARVVEGQPSTAGRTRALVRAAQSARST